MDAPALQNSLFFNQSKPVKRKRNENNNAKKKAKVVEVVEEPDMGVEEIVDEPAVIEEEPVVKDFYADKEIMEDDQLMPLLKSDLLENIKPQYGVFLHKPIAAPYFPDDERRESEAKTAKYIDDLLPSIYSEVSIGATVLAPMILLNNKHWGLFYACPVYRYIEGNRDNSVDILVLLIDPYSASNSFKDHNIQDVRRHIITHKTMMIEDREFHIASIPIFLGVQKDGFSCGSWVIDVANQLINHNFTPVEEMSAYKLYQRMGQPFPSECKRVHDKILQVLKTWVARVKRWDEQFGENSYIRRLYNKFYDKFVDRPGRVTMERHPETVPAMAIYGNYYAPELKMAEFASMYDKIKEVLDRIESREKIAREKFLSDKITAENARRDEIAARKKAELEVQLEETNRRHNALLEETRARELRELIERREKEKPVQKGRAWVSIYEPAEKKFNEAAQKLDQTRMSKKKRAVEYEKIREQLDKDRDVLSFKDAFKNIHKYTKQQWVDYVRKTREVLTEAEMRAIMAEVVAEERDEHEDETKAEDVVPQAEPEDEPEEVIPQAELEDEEEGVEDAAVLPAQDIIAQAQADDVFVEPMVEAEDEAEFAPVEAFKESDFSGSTLGGTLTYCLRMLYFYNLVHSIPVGSIAASANRIAFKELSAFTVFFYESVRQLADKLGLTLIKVKFAEAYERNPEYLTRVTSEIPAEIYPRLRDETYRISCLKKAHEVARAFALMTEAWIQAKKEGIVNSSPTRNTVLREKVPKYSKDDDLLLTPAQKQSVSETITAVASRTDLFPAEVGTQRSGTGRQKQKRRRGAPTNAEIRSRENAQAALQEKRNNARLKNVDAIVAARNAELKEADRRKRDKLTAKVAEIEARQRQRQAAADANAKPLPASLMNLSRQIPPSNPL